MLWIVISICNEWCCFCKVDNLYICCWTIKKAQIHLFQYIDSIIPKILTTIRNNSHSTQTRSIIWKFTYCNVGNQVNNMVIFFIYGEEELFYLSCNRHHLMMISEHQIFSSVSALTYSCARWSMQSLLLPFRFEIAYKGNKNKPAE